MLKGALQAALSGGEKALLELLDLLRANDCKMYIVSGGGIDFLRVFAEEVWGVPPDQVIGSSIRAKYERGNGIPVLALGSSDGGFEMLEWTAGGDGP